MKKIFIILSFILIVISSFNQIYADGNNYSVSIKINGKKETNIQNGDIVTVGIYIDCPGDTCKISGFQDEIVYDSLFLEIIEGSQITNGAFRSKDIALRDRHRAYYLNYVGIDDYLEINNSLLVGSFQAKVISKTGLSGLYNNNVLLSDENGNFIDELEILDAKAIINNDCEIIYEHGDNQTIEIVEYNKKLNNPMIESREGVYSNWNKDIDNVEENWDFNKDRVSENMTLYGTIGEYLKSINIPFVPLLLSLVIIIVLIIYVFTIKKQKKKAR